MSVTINLLKLSSARERTCSTGVSLSRRVAMQAVRGLDVVVLMATMAIVSGTVWAWWCVGALVGVESLLTLTGQYRSRITLSVARDMGPLAASVAVPFVALALFPPAGISTAMLLTVGAVATIALTAQRALSYMLIRALRSRGWFAETTLIVGTGGVGKELAATLGEHPEYGLQPIGFLDDIGKERLPLPVFGGVDLLGMVLTEENVDRVVVAFGAAREADLIKVLRECEDRPVDVHVVPRFFELGVVGGHGQVDDVWGFPLLSIRGSFLRRRVRTVKRALDVILALAALVMVSPLYAMVTLVVKVSSSGPVHFRQERIGQYGRRIEVLKFRTMLQNSRSDTEWNPSVEETTRIGRILRLTGVDELPQLWNVVRGDMSLVGPRPERPFFVEQFRVEIPRYDDRHRVPSGLTGLAQVHGLRGDTPIDERVRLDNHYIENWSLWRDLVILGQTLSAVIRNTVNLRDVTPANRLDSDSALSVHGCRRFDRGKEGRPPGSQLPTPPSSAGRTMSGGLHQKAVEGGQADEQERPALGAI